MRHKIVAAMGAAVLMLADGAAALAQAPTWSREQTAVWNRVAQSWADEVARNGRWPGNYVHDRVVAWDSSFPMPRYRDSMEKWTRFNDQQRRILQYELAPAAITVAGNTAVVHYTGVSVSQRGEDKPEREAFGAVETLVRNGGDWRFLSVTGFDLTRKNN